MGPKEANLSRSSYWTTNGRGETKSQRRIRNILCNADICGTRWEMENSGWLWLDFSCNCRTTSQFHPRKSHSCASLRNQHNRFCFWWPCCQSEKSRDFGANFDLKNHKRWFPHPVTGGKVYSIMDAVHMIELLRNLIGEKKENWILLFDNPVKWDNNLALYDQKAELGLRGGNKLSKIHLYYHANKMKVYPAIQLLSTSIVDSLQVVQTWYQRKSSSTRLWRHYYRDYKSG